MSINTENPNSITPTTVENNSLQVATFLSRALSKMGLAQLSTKVTNRVLDKEFIKIIQEAEERAKTVTRFSLPLSMTFRNEAGGIAAEARKLSVTYPSMLIEEFFTPEARAVLARGYHGNDFEYSFLNRAWPNFVYLFRPSVQGEAALIIEGMEDIVIPACFLTVHPNHLWKMVKFPGTGYKEGVHHDASFGPFGAETRTMLLELFRRNGGDDSQFEELPSAEELEADPQMVSAIGDLFRPIANELQKLGETVLDITAVREVVRRQRSQLELEIGTDNLH